MSDEVPVFALKRTETLVSEASVRPLKRKVSIPVRELDAANKEAEKKDNPREPSLPSDTPATDPVVKDQGEAITVPSPQMSNETLPGQGNVAFMPPPPPPNPFASVTPQPQQFSPPPPLSIFLTRSHPPPPFSQAGRDADLITVRTIMDRLTVLPEPRILSATALRNSGANRLTTLDPLKELTAYHLINHFLNRIQSCVSSLNILLHGGHGDEQGFRRTLMTREHFAMVGRRLLENLGYLINIVHGLELSECPRRR